MSNPLTPVVALTLAMSVSGCWKPASEISGLDFESTEEPAISSPGVCYPAGSAFYSVGVLDNGFNIEHQGFDGRALLAFHDYEQVKEDIENGLINTFIDDSEAGDHGTHVSGIAYSPDVSKLTLDDFSPKEVVVAINYDMTDSIYPPEKAVEVFNGVYRDTFNVDLPSGECLSPSYRTNACSGITPFLFNQYSTSGQYPLAATNMSFQFEDFTNFLAFDLDFYAYTYPDEPDAEDGLSKDLGTISGSPSYFGRNLIEYNLFKSAIENDLALVIAAGNAGESLTDLSEIGTYREFSEKHPGEIINLFYDENQDQDGDGVIDASEKGLKGHTVFVGSLDASGNLSEFSNTPGSDKNVQSRFILAEGEMISSFSGQDNVGFTLMSGTSMAAPKIAQIITRLKSEFSNVPIDVVLDYLLYTASRDFPEYTPEMHGQGIVDYESARTALKKAICLE